MTRKNYIELAKIVGNTFAAFDAVADEQTQKCGALTPFDFSTTVYENLYTPLVDYLKQDNSRFDTLRFSYAVAQARAGK